MGSRTHGKSRAQSLVEFTVLLPVLLIMISGLIEFGFLLNYYLDVIDAAREVARFAANVDPIRDQFGAPLYPNEAFYSDSQFEARHALKQSSDGRIDWDPPPPPGLPCDPVNGDVVISVFSVHGNQVEERFPRLDPNGRSMCKNETSKFPYKVKDPIYTGTSIDSGLVLVEIYYKYDQILGLPWIKAFVPDPVTLYAYSWMPNKSVEPTPAAP